MTRVRYLYLWACWDCNATATTVSPDKPDECELKDADPECKHRLRIIDENVPEILD